jgi:predicted class III extradiol MEMO1 family dioxygenase
MTTPESSQDPNAQPASQGPAFNNNLPHHTRPKIRAIRGFPVQAKAPDGTEHQMLGLADARQISDRVAVVMPGVSLVLPLMDGSRSIDQIVMEIGRGLTRSVMEQLIAQLDGAALLEGPAFEELLAKMRADFDSQPILPPGSTAAFVDAMLSEDTEAPADEPARSEYAARRVRTYFDSLIAEALADVPDPAFTALPKAIVAPHLDYPRGGLNYAAVYGRLRVADRPDRVIILGTNHFGVSTGIAACDKGFSTVLGACEIDTDLASGLRSALGDAIFANRFDHEREHSIELQVTWIQHVFGKDAGGRYPKVFGALVHDPVVKNGESYDGQGVALQPFVDALKAQLAKLPGKTLIVSSADLSHVGRAFGDEVTLAAEEGSEEAQGAEQARNRVFGMDDEMLGLVVGNKPSELVASMAWQQNPTRWCSVGNLVATLMVAQPADVRMLRYGPVMDPQGLGMVTSAAMVMT